MTCTCKPYHCPHESGMNFSRRERILATVVSTASDFIYYDRKEDHWLPRGEIEAAIAAGEITWDEIIDQFRKELVESEEL